MRLKRYLTNLLIRTWLHLKNLKGLVLIPLFILDILIPMLSYLVYKRYGIGDQLYIQLMEYSQWLMPFASVWCPLFVLRDYLESDGNEVLFVNRNSNKFLDAFLLFLGALLNIAILFSVYNTRIPHINHEYIRILAICIFYFGIVYGVSFLTKSTTITTLITVLYTVANIYFGRGKDHALLIYVSTERINKDVFLSDYFPLLLLGIGLTVLGVFINVKKFDYNNIVKRWG